MNLEFEKLDQKDREARLKAQLELQKLNSQERQTDLRVTAELQEAEMREDREIDSNLTELAKLVRESREQE
jgi:ABC-type Fe3+/spermidine/putrescine transport system ATPase subunit